MAKLITTSIPKSRAGRQAKPLDAELLAGLIEGLTTAPLLDDRPAGYGPAEKYDTEGKATSAGRKYAAAVSEALEGKTVRVNVYENADKFSWRIYIPLAAQKA